MCTSREKLSTLILELKVRLRSHYQLRYEAVAQADQSLSLSTAQCPLCCPPLLAVAPRPIVIGLACLSLFPRDFQFPLCTVL
jgi:hypothetical protein